MLSATFKDQGANCSQVCNYIHLITFAVLGGVLFSSNNTTTYFIKIFTNLCHSCDGARSCRDVLRSGLNTYVSSAFLPV